MTRERKKALLRSLIDKVVLQRMAADRISIRIVWRGVETSEFEIEVAVYTHWVLSRGVEMEARLLDLARQGIDDETIAAQLTVGSYRSACCGHVPVSTVRHPRVPSHAARLATDTSLAYSGMAADGRVGDEIASLPRLDRAAYPQRQNLHRL
jgi:hypothetical protein